MKTIYTPILELLSQKTPELQYIDLDNGQLDTKERPPVAFPCLLINITFSGCRSLDDTDQECPAIITVRFGFDQLTTGATSNLAPEEIREKSLQNYTLIEKVHRTLQGFETNNFEALSRKNQQKRRSNNGTFQYQIQYTTIHHDTP